MCFPADRTPEEVGKPVTGPGGKVAAWVSKKTGYAMVGADPRSYYERAKELGVTVLDAGAVREADRPQAAKHACSPISRVPEATSPPGFPPSSASAAGLRRAGVKPQFCVSGIRLLASGCTYKNHRIGVFAFIKSHSHVVIVDELSPSSWLRCHCSLSCK